MHSLLENPFGSHPCKFPLRSQCVDHVKQTTALLRPAWSREPASIRDAFRPKFTVSLSLGSGGEPRCAPAAAGGGEGPPLQGAALQDESGRPLDPADSRVAGRVADFTLLAVAGFENPECVPAGASADALPATVWRLREVRGDKRCGADSAAAVAAAVAEFARRQREAAAAAES